MTETGKAELDAARDDAIAEDVFQLQQDVAKLKRQVAVISFDQLGALFDLKQEHHNLLCEQARMHRVREPGVVDCRGLARATIAIEDGRGNCARVKADPDQTAQFMAETIERRLAGIEQKMAAMGIAGIKRELPDPRQDPRADLDDEIPF
jgi:hypothetical protein